MTRRDKVGIAILCALCFVLGYYAGRIVTTAEIIQHFGPIEAEQILHPKPVSDELAFPAWRKA